MFLTPPALPLANAQPQAAPDATGTAAAPIGAAAVPISFADWLTGALTPPANGAEATAPASLPDLEEAAAGKPVAPRPGKGKADRTEDETLLPASAPPQAANVPLLAIPQAEIPPAASQVLPESTPKGVKDTEGAPPGPMPAALPSAPPADTDAGTAAAKTALPSSIAPSPAPIHRASAQDAPAKAEDAATPDTPPSSPTPTVSVPVALPDHPRATAAGRSGESATASPRAAPAEQLAPTLTVLAGTSDGASHVTVRLNPVELGTVEVRIEKPKDGPTTVALTAERPETLQLLVRDQTQLHHALDQAGISDARSISFHLAPAAATESGGSSTQGQQSFHQATGGETRDGTPRDQPGAERGGGQNGGAPYRTTRLDLPDDSAPEARSASRTGVNITA